MGKSTVQKGNEKSNVSKLPAVFSGIEPNSHLLHLSVLRQLSNQRAGTACTKTRSEVRGGGKKPWKQKGTGRARAGSIRSPLWVGGGITHGPKPRSFRLELTKKARNLAIAQAIVAKADQINTLKSLKAARSVAMFIIDQSSREDALCNIVIAYTQTRAPQSIETARSIAGYITDKEDKGRALCAISIAYTQLGTPENLQTARSIARGIRNREDRDTALCAISMSQNPLGVAQDHSI